MFKEIPKKMLEEILEKMLGETKECFKNMYSTRRETIEWMITSGSEIESIEATIIKNVALGN